MFKHQVVRALGIACLVPLALVLMISKHGLHATDHFDPSLAVWRIHNEEGTSQGTAFAIGPNRFMTAAHVVKDLRDKKSTTIYLTWKNTDIRVTWSHLVVISMTHGLAIFETYESVKHYLRLADDFFVESAERLYTLGHDRDSFKMLRQTEKILLHDERSYRIPVSGKLHPDFSGAPVLQGTRVVAVVESSVSNIAFATKLRRLKQVVNEEVGLICSDFSFSQCVEKEFQEVNRSAETMWAAKRANVRAGPSTDYEKVGLLDVGEMVHVVARTENWLELSQLAGQPRRFVYASLLSHGDPAKTQETAPESVVVTTNSFDGGEYRGPTRNGRPHGRGVVTWPSGNRYEGDFVDGSYTDYGTLIWADGDRYEGKWRGSKRTGRGVFTWANGDRYEGGFVDGKRHGRGVWASANKKARVQRYEGDFRDGVFHGRGVAIYQNGSRYEGEFGGGKRNGRGTYLYTDGTRIVGRFEDGQPQEYATTQQLRNAKACIDRLGNDKYRNICRENLAFSYCFTETDGYIETCGRPAVKELRGKPEHYYTHLEHLSPGETHKVPFGDELPYRWAVCPYTSYGAPYVATSERNNKYGCRTHWRSFSNDKQAAHSKLVRRAEQLERQRERERELARQRERERERQEAEWEAERERERAETWNNINRNLQNTLNTLQMLRNSGGNRNRTGVQPQGDYQGGYGDCPPPEYRENTCTP